MLLSILLLIIVLGVIIFIHELGHFIFAKKANIYVHEFSLGMGPKIFSKRRKNDETEYTIRAFPIGGFVRLAGEEIDTETDKLVENNRKLHNAKFTDKFKTIAAGAIFNFILAIILLLFSSLIFGSPKQKPYLGELNKDYPAYKSGLRKDDLILKIDNKKISNWDKVVIELQTIKEGKELTFLIKDKNNNTKEIKVKPILEKENNKEVYKYGISISEKINRGILISIKYSFVKFISLFETMFIVISSLITGKMGMSTISGPVGLYSIMGSITNINSLINIIALISVNVGFINLLPFPAFDGGRLLFMIIEKIKGSPVNPKIENTIHTIGFILLMILMLYITIFDIKKFF